MFGLFRLTPIWPVSKGAQSATASGRVEILAEPRPVHSQYKYRRSVYTVIPEAARAATCSGRLEQLSGKESSNCLEKEFTSLHGTWVEKRPMRVSGRTGE